MFFLRKLIVRLLIIKLLGFAIRKMRDSSDPRARKVASSVDRVLGGVMGTTPAQRVQPPSRRVGRSVGSAAVGGLTSYFFDPQRGAERRARAKAFAASKMGRRRDVPAGYTVSANPMTSAHSPSAIT